MSPNGKVCRKRPLSSTKAKAETKIRRICSTYPVRPGMMKNANGYGEMKTTGSSTEVCPQQLLLEIVKSKGVVVNVVPSLELKGFFSDFTDAEMDAYDQDVLTAIRSRNIDQLRTFHESGRPLKCSNQFGESLLHLACRRGFVDVARFLILEAGVPVQVKDDYGRTPLHDACWTCDPNFELVELILSQSSDLLFLSDRRGHCPLSYTRKEHWSAWTEFLKSSTGQDLLSPVRLAERVH
jgi:Ankyrin repeats (3 copies)